MSDLEIQAAKYRKQVEQVMKTNKDYQCQIKDLQTKLDDEQRKFEDIQENTLVIERRSNLLQSEIEELRSGLEQAERIRCTFSLMSTNLLFFNVLKHSLQSKFTLLIIPPNYKRSKTCRKRAHGRLRASKLAAYAKYCAYQSKAKN